ncbi:diacylglycerol/polyprenol kinase family protein [Methanotorris igneus]|uniref:Phosphatidate cytidylyltransferase n=1 Tax=Methanotorris igneus (strain DSM 5666 / JCM 11834 / Kol 5) TaxID=880724 RepID=F6BDY2_METIK|nr:hypothetical protein [Methanotorris igneus]AEF96693.1 phosphatidate cytidylyltransferase [Methanotorris igneus Kol 5]
MREIYRQLIHMVFGSITAFSILYFGKKVIYPLFILTLAGIFLHFYLRKHYAPIISDLLRLCGRENEYGKGAVLFAVGVLIAVILVDNINAIFYAILVFSISDALATLVGIRGKIKIFGKTLEGFLAFFISACIILHSFGIYGVLVAFVGAFIELISKKIKIDDNLVLPIFLAFILNMINW